MRSGESVTASAQESERQQESQSLSKTVKAFARESELKQGSENVSKKPNCQQDIQSISKRV